MKSGTFISPDASTPSEQRSSRSKTERIQVCGKNCRKLTNSNMMRHQQVQQGANAENVMGVVIEKASHVKLNEHTSEFSEWEPKTIKPNKEIKPLILPSRLKRLDYQPNHNSRSQYLHHKISIQCAQSTKRKQIRDKRKSIPTTLSNKKLHTHQKKHPLGIPSRISEENFQPLCIQVEALKLNDNTVKASHGLKKHIHTDHSKCREAICDTNKNTTKVLCRSTAEHNMLSVINPMNSIQTVYSAWR